MSGGQFLPSGYGVLIYRPAAASMIRASEMVEQDRPDPAFDAMTSRLLRRKALRRAAEELNTTSGPGLEDVLARISAEVTAEASARIAEPTSPRSRPQGR
jgi:phage shock protein A